MHKKQIIIISITNILIFLLFSFASMDLFQYDGKTFFFYIGLLFFIYSVLKNGKLHLMKDPLIVLIFLEFFISGIFAQMGSLTSEYKKTAIVMPILMLPIYLEAGIFESLIIKKESIINIIIKGIKFVCIIQFIYMPFQYVLYHYGNIDLNKLIFVDTLGLVENASFIRDWVWYPSGFTYHSALVAPLMVIGFILFDNIYFRILIFFDAIICGNSSAIIGVIVAILLTILFNLLKGSKNNKIKRKTIITSMGVIVIIAVVLLSTDVLTVIFDKISYISTRLFGTSKDSSTLAHLYYYYDYPKILSKSSLTQTLFGYGYNCSGSIFSALYNRMNIGNWSVESEIMDRLYSLGIIGFILYYIFLIKIIVKGIKIDKRYVIITVAIIIQGFGYNIQWDYVFLIELIFYICIKKKINIFDYE